MDMAQNSAVLTLVRLQHLTQKAQSVVGVGLQGRATFATSNLILKLTPKCSSEVLAAIAASGLADGGL